MYKKILILGFLILCWPVLASAQMPAKEPFVAQEWQKYTKELLIKAAKNSKYAKLATELEIEISENEKPSAASWVGDKKILITKGRIQMMDTEGEYLSVVAHEFGHIALEHPSTTTMSIEAGDGARVILDTDYVMLREQEINADMFAIDMLKNNGYDPCERYRGFAKLLKLLGVFYKEELGPNSKILLERLEILKKPCEKI